MKVNVTHVAKLANLPLSDEEKNKFSSQLTDVLTYVEKLKEVKTDGVEPTSQVTGLENVTREDEAGDSLPQEKTLSQAPAKKDDKFQVKGIFTDD